MSLLIIFFKITSSSGIAYSLILCTWCQLFLNRTKKTMYYSFIHHLVLSYFTKSYDQIFKPLRIATSDILRFSIISFIVTELGTFQTKDKLVKHEYERLNGNYYTSILTFESDCITDLRMDMECF
jgi:hypothetical protein